MTINLDIRREAEAAPFMDLLALADPSPVMIADYVADGRLYSARWDGVVVGVFVLLPLDDAKWEIKNIAVAEEWQHKGVGKALLASAIHEAKGEGATVLQVGTGNSSLDQLAFYQKAGFRMTRVVPNYFTLNYADPIFENGIQCRDRVVLKMEINQRNS